jgi:hypothetical protein
MHQRHAELGRQARADVAGIGVVAVDQVRQLVLLAQEAEHVVREGVQMVPELFLGQVARRAGLDAHDARTVAEVLDGYGVVRADVGVVHQAREQVDAGDVVACRQRAGQLHDVEGLAAGVGVAAEFQFCRGSGRER